MKHTIKVFRAVSFMALFLAVTFFASRSWALLPVALQPEALQPERILSITPMGTEILYCLGLGDRVVGVTKYCTWPPEATTKPNLGDMMYVNLESVMAINPDIVLVSEMNIRVGERIASMGYRTVTVYQDSFERVCESLLLVGRECGVEEVAKLKVAELRKSVSDKTRTVPSGSPRPRVLVAVGRDPSDDTLRKVYVAGRGSFYDDLLMSAGAVNACEQETAYAHISREGLLRIDPDVIIELAGDHGMKIPADRLISYWASVPELSAVRNGRVSVIKGDFTFRAGPRYPQILEAFINAIHGGAIVQ